MDTFLGASDEIRAARTKPAASGRARTLALVATALLTAACWQADPTLAADPGPQEPFPSKGESLDGLKVWLQRNTRLAPEAFVSVGDRYAAALISSDYSGPWIRLVKVNIEVVAEDFAARLGGRSAELTADIDCSGRLARPKEMTVYSGSDLKGAGETTKFPDRWISAGQGAYLDDVVAAACDAGFKRPFEAAAQTASISNPPEQLKPSLAQASPSPATAPPAAPPPAPPAASPEPSKSAGPAQPAPPKPAPAPPARAAAPPPAKPAAPPPAKPAAKPPAAAPQPAAGGGFAVQLGAFASTALADEAWARQSSKPPMRGRAHRVQSVASEGKTFYRLLVTGFADRAAAQALCAEVKQAGGDCLVRPE